ncbi:MAG: hypothetical protein A3J74_05155 [Elusimicrobia bacterium RIFCSPHIGHO2_02_FULL_57_9]|nr:MAG: hypothetical protein A3J74_05155 [Elusimicrobia bacterium RIFCSPHIGHO2_02_FULL_57_9]
MDYRHIVLKDGPVATVILNRPELRNAMDDQTLRELSDVFRRLGKAPDLRAVVVRAEGKDFCAGADINWMRRAGRMPSAKSRKDAALLVDMCHAVDACPAPVITVARGGIYGGGLGLISVCDIVIAETCSKMCFSECRLGIVPAVISCFVIPKIGEAQARRYYLTAEVFNAETALRLGIVHEVAEESEIESRLEHVLDNILRNGPQAVREAKAMLRKFPGLAFEKRVKRVLDTLTRLRASPEGQEGLSAFLEKRPPSWAAKESSRG